MNPSEPDSPIEEPEVQRIPRAPEPRATGRPALSRKKRAAAFAVAAVADLLQWVAFPLFVAGGAAPWVDALDVVVAAVQIGLLGWHWAFLPTFIVELAPVVDLVPTWTLAVWLATRGRKE